MSRERYMAEESEGSVAPEPITEAPETPLDIEGEVARARARLASGEAKIDIPDTPKIAEKRKQLKAATTAEFVDDELVDRLSAELTQLIEAQKNKEKGRNRPEKGSKFDFKSYFKSLDLDSGFNDFDKQFVEVIGEEVFEEHGADPSNKKTWSDLIMALREGGGGGFGSSAYRNRFRLEQKPDGSYVLDTEKAPIESGYGMPMQADVPRYAKDKYDYVRSALEAYEAAPAEGNPVVERRLRRAEEMVRALQEDEYKKKHPEFDENGKPTGDENAGIGQRLYEEFLARTEFKKTFARFERVGDVKSAANLVQDLKPEYLNPIIHIDAVMEAFVYLDQRAESYIQASMADKLDDIRIKAAEEIRQKENKRIEETNKDLPEESRRQLIERPEDMLWAVKLAERFWMITGRLSAQDKEIKGKFTGGVFFLRRLFNFHKWAEKNKDTYHLHPELIKGVNIGGQDYLSLKIPEMVYKRAFAKKKYELINQGINGETAGKQADEFAREVAKDNGFIPEAVVDPKTGKQEIKDGVPQWKWNYKIDKGIGKDGVPIYDLVDLSGMKWKDFDFAAFDPISPMLQWSIYNLSGAEEIRENLKAYLKVPTSDAIAKTKDMWEHLDIDQWNEKGKLIRNFAEYVWKGEGRKKGEYPKLSRADIDLMIAQSAYQLGLSAEDSIKVSKMVLDNKGNSLINQLLVIKDYFKPDQAFGIFIWEIIKGIIQQGLSQKG